jgi:hypothetical protein
MKCGLLLTVLTLFSFNLLALKNYRELYPTGEYLEYPSVDEHSKVVKKVLSHYSAEAFKFPFKAGRKTGELVVNHIKSVGNTLRVFLSNLPIDHHKANGAVADWEREHFDYYKNAKGGIMCIVHAPKDSWKIFKGVIKKVGLGIPKRTMRALKTAFHQSYALVRS